MSEKQDLRTIRTQKHMRQAFLELLAEKPVQEISVKELAERAEISRGTFYLYFDSIEDMLSSYEEEIFSAFEDGVHHIIVESKTFEDVVRQLIAFPFPKDDSMLPLIRIMYGTHGNPETLHRGSRILEKEILKYFQSDLPEWDFRFLITFVCSGMTSALQLWVQEDNAHSVEELSDLIFENLLGDSRIVRRIHKKKRT